MNIFFRHAFHALTAALLLNMSVTAGNAQSSAANLPGYKNWSDKSVAPTAAVLCIHGLGLNSGVFDDFGTRMAHKGVLVLDRKSVV